MALTRVLENVDENHDTSFEAHFTRRLAVRIDVIFPALLFAIFGFRLLFDIYVAPQLFPWPRSRPPTVFILESPLQLIYSTELTTENVFENFGGLSGCSPSDCGIS